MQQRGFDGVLQDQRTLRGGGLEDGDLLKGTSAAHAASAGIQPGIRPAGSCPAGRLTAMQLDVTLSN